MRPPITSWGVLLNEAQNVNVVALYPWLMFPVIPVILVILAFNFLGDGLRDAADPYRVRLAEAMALGRTRLWHSPGASGGGQAQEGPA